MDESPCEICGHRSLDPASMDMFIEVFCCHQRNLLLQKAPHMMHFFYPHDHSLSKLRKERDPVVAEVNVENEPLRPLPRVGTGNFVTESESLLDKLSSNTLVGPKDVKITNDITFTTTDIKVITDESKSDASQGGWFKPPKKTKLFQPATRMSISPKYARTRQSSMTETPFGPKKAGKQ